METGRNELCPCGSGKKYKRCCASKEVPRAENFFWHRLRSSLDGLSDKILRISANIYGPESLYEAWYEFHGQESGKIFDPDSPVNQVFIPWFLYHWVHDPEDMLISNDPPEFLPPQRRYY